MIELGDQAGAQKIILKELENQFGGSARAARGTLGGALTAMATGHIDPDMAVWTTSGEFVFIAILGGTGHVAAPFIAAIVFSVIRTFAIQEAPNTWQMALGIVLLALILFLPKGLWSLVHRPQQEVRT